MRRIAKGEGCGRDGAPAEKKGLFRKGTCKRCAAILAGAVLLCAVIAVAVLFEAPVDSEGSVRTEGDRILGQTPTKEAVEDGVAKSTSHIADEDRPEAEAQPAGLDGAIESEEQSLQEEGFEALAAASPSPPAKRAPAEGKPSRAPSSSAPAEPASDPSPAEPDPQPEPVPPPSEPAQPEPPETRWVHGYKCGSCPFHSTDASAMEEHQRSQLLAGADHGAYGSWSWEE